MSEIEYSASELRVLLQELFPHRRLVLSQFTFFNKSGVSRPTGKLFRRGRQCYRLVDVLPIATILALKEEGIPYKNVESVPSLIQEHAEQIFFVGEGCRLSGFGDQVHLSFPEYQSSTPPLEAFLESSTGMQIFWAFDVGVLANQLQVAAEKAAQGGTQTGVAQAA